MFMSCVFSRPVMKAHGTDRQCRIRVLDLRLSKHTQHVWSTQGCRDGFAGVGTASPHFTLYIVNVFLYFGAVLVPSVPPPPRSVRFLKIG